jgi:hypothetical protein
MTTSVWPAMRKEALTIRFCLAPVSSSPSSNEQTFLRQIGRIRTETWVFWRDGIRSNFKQPVFEWAWEELEKTNTTEYSELRHLLKSDFKENPKRCRTYKSRRWGISLVGFSKGWLPPRLIFHVTSLSTCNSWLSNMVPTNDL